MRFSLAWAQTASQNVVLKWALAASSLAVIFLAFTTSSLSLRNPLVIERVCHSGVSNVARTVDGNPNKDEITAFIKKALSFRFDTEVNVEPGFLSVQQDGLREKEQAELAQKKIIQNLVIKKIDVQEGKMAVHADRLLAVDQIRSAFQFPLLINISKTTRSEGNPYGLILTDATPRQKDTKEEEKR